MSSIKSKNMKAKFHLIIFTVALLFIGNMSYAQRSYEMELLNLVQINETELRFDVRFRNTAADPVANFIAVEMLQFQVAFNTAMLNGGGLNNTYLQYVSGTSDIVTPVASPIMPVSTNVTSDQTVIQWVSKPLSTDEYTVKITTNAWVKVGTFKVILKATDLSASSKNFASVLPNLTLVQSGCLCNWCEVDYDTFGDGGFTRAAGATPNLITSKTLINSTLNNALYSHAFTGTGNFSDVTKWNNSVVITDPSYHVIPVTTNNVSIGALSTANPPVAIIGNCTSTGSNTVNNLTIQNTSTLTLSPAAELTVTGETAIKPVSGGLTIQSTASGTGSLITGSSTGSAVAQRYMTGGAWHMVGAPLNGQDIAAFLTAPANSNIPTNGGNRGMMDYNPALNAWKSYFTNSTLGSFDGGVGYSMRVTGDGAVTFAGTIKTGNKQPTVVPAKWNCIANPYTSAIGINTGTGGGSYFLNENALIAPNLDPSYSAVYVWDKTDASNDQGGMYTIISNTPIPVGSPAAAISTSFVVQQGQAFFVKMNTGKTLVDFTPAMQIHNPTLAFKSTQNAWPVISLKAAVADQKSATYIGFNSAMTKGLDPTYDAGLLKGTSDLVLYSKLVEDNGVSFAIQALPTNDISKFIIPVGIDFKTGGEVTFSADLFNLPADCKAILEDKVTKTFTDLSQSTYKVAIPANSVIADRFQLHTGDLVSAVDSEISKVKLSAFVLQNQEIRIVGEVGANAVATLYDVQGKIVVVQKLNQGSLNTMGTSYLKSGVYLLWVKDNLKMESFKILIRQ